MGLYLLEMDVDASTPEKNAAIMERVEQVIKAGGTPNAKLIAGPWVSYESPKLWLVVDNPDLHKSFAARIQLYNAGLVPKVRVHPIATWEEAITAAKAAGA
ncbi:MAG TPA: hypothetical protein VMT61_15225 [Candidatus Binataceae bacterium]|nr:hypothetical protein [Candidatus Binataceae bacterium]